MTTLLDRLDAIPVSLGVLIAYGTIATLTGVVEPEGAKLVQFGASAGALVQDGEPWRLLSAAFVHIGPLHLLLNCAALLWLGPALEGRLGSLRFLGLYVISALGGSVNAMLFTDPLALVAGGSGALFGMMGAAFALRIRQGRTQLDGLSNHGTQRLLSVMLINLAFGLVAPQISNSGHLGGLVTGFVWTYLFLDRGRSGADRISRFAQVGWLTLLLSLTTYVCVPVLRWDYQQRRMIEAGNTTAARAWAQALGRMHSTENDWIIEAWGKRGRDVYERWLPGRD